MPSKSSEYANVEFLEADRFRRNAWQMPLALSCPVSNPSKPALHAIVAKRQF